MTPHAVYNEFITDFCERHGECQATRDEAHEIADRMSAFGTALGAGARIAGMSDVDVECMVDSVTIPADESILIATYARAAYHA